MKVIHIAALGLALVIGTAVSASAQGGGAQQQGAGRPGRANMLAGIELSADQKLKFDSITAKFQPEMAKIREDIQAGGDRAALMKKAGELRDKQSVELRAILTTEQQVVFDKNAAELKARMEQRPPAAPPTR